MIKFGSNDKYHQFLSLKGDIWYWGPRVLSDPQTIKIDVKYEPSGLAGDIYQVVMFKNKGGKLENVENFNCVLTDPPYYIVSVFENGYYGVCGRQFQGSPYSAMLDEMQKSPYTSWVHMCKEVFHTGLPWKVKD